MEVVSADPAEHEAWLEAMKEAVERTMSVLARNAGYAYTIRGGRRDADERTPIVTSASRMEMAIIEFQTTAAAIWPRVRFATRTSAAARSVSVGGATAARAAAGAVVLNAVVRRRLHQRCRERRRRRRAAAQAEYQ